MSLSSLISVATSLPLPSPLFSDQGKGWGDLPELLHFGDQPSSPWDSDAVRPLNELASPKPPMLTPPPSPPPSVLNCTPFPPSSFMDMEEVEQNH